MVLVVERDAADGARNLDQPRFQITHVRLVQAVGARGDKHRRRPPVLPGVMAADTLGHVLALADVEQRPAAVVIAQQQIDARVPGLAALERIDDARARRQEDVPRPVEFLGRLHPVRLAVDEEQFQRPTLRSAGHSTSPFNSPAISPSSDWMSASIASRRRGGL